MEREHRRGGWLFLALVILAYGVTGLIEPGMATRAAVAFIRMLRDVAPALVLVFGLMFVAERYLTLERTRAWLGRNSDLRGWLLALMAGMLSTGPVYTWYGLLADLQAKGMRPALVAVVLYARAIKLPLLPLLAHYFGLHYAIVLSLTIAAFSFVNGLPWTF